MFYYAEINSEYQVINKYCLSEESDNPNYISITEDLYTNGNDLGDIVGQFYNKLLGVIEIVDPEWDMGQTCWMRYKDFQMRLSTKLDNMDYDINNLANGNSNSVTQEDLQVLEDAIATKADIDHSHSEYALVGHTHDDYVSQVSFDSAIATLESEIEGKAEASHTHSDYASSTHLHDEYANVNHNHDSDYAPFSHSHTEYVTSTTFNALASQVDEKATETYVNIQIDAIDIPNALSDLITDSTHRVVTDAEKDTWNAKSDFSGSYNDLTDKPSIPSISGLATETYVDEAISTKADSNHNHNDTYYTETEVNSLLATKSDSAHNHDTSYDAIGSASNAFTSSKAYTDELIADEVTNRDSAIATAKSSAISTAASDATTKANNALASAKTYADSVGATIKSDLLNGAGSAYDTLKELGDLIVDNADAIEALETIASGKANASHTHAISDITNLQTTLDGKATQTSLDSHTSNVSNPHGVTLAQLGVTATASELNVLDGITATVTELNYVDGVTSNIQTQLNAKATSSHTHTIANITNLQSTLDGKAASSHTHTVANISDLTATAIELNYVDGVTSNIQTQLDGKAASGHTHSYAGSSSVGGSANSAVKLATARTISLTGDVTGSTSFDGSGNVSITTTIADDSHNHTISNIDNLQTSLDSKQAAITGAATTITNSNLTTNRALVSDSSGKVAVSAVTSTELGYLDGVTSNVQSQIDGKAASSHTHSYAGSSSVGGAATSANKLNTNAGDANTPVYFSNGVPVACTSLDLNTSGSSASCTGNSTTATKLATSRTIGLGTGATGTATSFDGSANITIPVTDVKESYLSWGGKSISGQVSPIDAACSNIHSANRFALAKADGITIEYSTDGSTYSDYGSTDASKVNLVSGIGSTHYIGARSASTTVNDKLRITLNATDMGVYTRLRKLLINISTGYSSGSNVIIEKAMKGSETTFTTIGTYSISGWSGWNSIPIGAAFGGGSTQTGNIAVLRLTFGITGVNSSQTYNALSIIDIIGIGDTYWSYPSTMAKTGHLYSYDASQNATFPAKVTATTFAGALSGNATTATTATKLGSSTVGGTAKPIYLNAGTATACSSTVGSATQPVYMSGGTITATTYTLGKSVPSDAVFTDTNTKVTNTLATTTKAYVTGTTSATTNTGTQVFDTGVYLDTTAGQLTATTFNGTTFSGSGVATVSEVETYLGI